MLEHLRTEAYPIYRNHIYPPESESGSEKMLSYEKNNRLIDESKSRLKSFER